MAQGDDARGSIERRGAQPCDPLGGAAGRARAERDGPQAECSAPTLQEVVMQEQNHRRFHAPHANLGAALGSNWFGQWAEATARFFGTPQYLIGQTLIVILWIIINGAALFSLQWDPYPF